MIVKQKADKVVFFSGGMGSFATAHRVFDEGTHLLFTDTLIEHKTLYKFLIDSFEYFFGTELPIARRLLKDLPEIHQDFVERKRILMKIQNYVNSKLPRVHWIRYELGGEGLSVWDIFYNDRFIGNSRVANCSTIIKQRLARDYVKEVFPLKEYSVYLGIDWSEEHRTKAPTKNWGRFAKSVEFPLTKKPYLSKADKKELLRSCGIEVPMLYVQGMEHNNCGGFCVRAGQGHFAKLAEIDIDTFMYHANQEEKLRSLIGKDVSILKRTRRGEVQTYPLKSLLRDIKGGGEIDTWDWGGCGCFVTDDEEDEEYVREKWTGKDLKIVRCYGDRRVSRGDD